MHTKPSLILMSTGTGPIVPSNLAGARLKKLRYERALVERAIHALTEVARVRELRGMRATGA